MASESETLADIVAEIRAYGAQPPPRLMWLEIADRIEAAWKRGREAVGNAAAIYASLVKIHDMTNALDEKCGVDPVEIRDLARAALAAPQRQCDVGTAEEQMERFREFCRQEKCGRYRCGWDCKATCIERCAIDWAQTPYEYEAQEGGAE